MLSNFNDYNILNEELIITPKDLKNEYKLNNELKKNVLNNRKIISNIINNKDNKFIIICGPCSIHDYKSTIEYANRLNKLIECFKNNIYIIMRTYLEKPRTSIGWKGIINDPYINNTFDINNGLKISRKLLIDLIKLNIPLSTELLNPMTYKYFDDLFSWISIGARTSESQIHREIASSLNIPVGFKNNTNGDIEPAINSIKASYNKNNFIYIDDNGKINFIKSKGNINCHIVLRGGNKRPNYYIKDIKKFDNIIKYNKINESLIIDCSHDNSYKNYKLQKYVAKKVINQKIKFNNYNIKGIMLESNINEGNQEFNSIENLKYGISITDSCINFEETEKIIKYIFNKLNK